MENQSFLANGSVFFFKPFLPLDNLLFFPTAMMAVVAGKLKDYCRCCRRFALVCSVFELLCRPAISCAPSKTLGVRHQGNHHVSSSLHLINYYRHSDNVISDHLLELNRSQKAQHKLTRCRISLCTKPTTRASRTSEFCTLKGPEILIGSRIVDIELSH
jgi:hypothetical protein